MIKFHLATGEDKIVAATIKRDYIALQMKMSDGLAAVDALFDTPGIETYIVEDSWLVAYLFKNDKISLVALAKLYDSEYDHKIVADFLLQEALMFSTEVH